MRGFITGNFYDHFVPINFIKSYQGEKYAYEFAFLLHYQAWLIFPAITGTMIFIYQIIMVSKNGVESFDTSLSFFFGIFTAIWSSAFIESWRRKERIIQFFWAINKEMIQRDDERSNEFKYAIVYNDISFDKFKRKVAPDLRSTLFYKALSFAALILVIGLMIIYIYLNGFF